MKMKGTISSDAEHAVVQNETSEVIRSSGLMHAGVLKETLEGKNRSSGLLRTKVLSVKTLRKTLEVLCMLKQ